MKYLITIVFFCVVFSSKAQLYTQNTKFNGLWSSNSNWTNILVVISTIPNDNTLANVNHIITINSTATCHSLNIGTSGALTIQSGASLEINNAFDNQGTFINNGTLILNGSTNNASTANLNIGGAVVFNSNFTLGTAEMQ